MRSRLSSRKKAFFILATILMIVIVPVSAYLGTVILRSLKLYVDTKSSSLLFIGEIHRNDKELGYSAVPNSRGFLALPCLPSLVLRYDENGFRIPDAGISVDQRPRSLLALGCSFTFGYGVEAEQAFPYLVGEKLGLETKNVAMAGYGLSQILIQARKEIPKHKPDYVLLQYSPWLAERSMSSFGPTNFGLLPTPYFTNTLDNIGIQLPTFEKKTDLPTGDFVNGRPVNAMTSLGFYKDMIAFTAKVGAPLFLHDDYYSNKLRFFQALGLVGRPSTDAKLITKAAYREINDLCKANGCKLVVINIGGYLADKRFDRGLFPKDAMIVNAQEYLIDRLSEKSDIGYVRDYYIWGCQPSRVVDSHPSMLAHQRIAECVTKAILDRKPYH